jgi:hypothetical protein
VLHRLRSVTEASIRTLSVVAERSRSGAEGWLLKTIPHVWLRLRSATWMIFLSTWRLSGAEVGFAMKPKCYGKKKASQFVKLF